MGAKPSYILRRAKSLNMRGSEHRSREGSCDQGAKLFLSEKFINCRQMRPVINLKRLNNWVEPQQFKMEGLRTLKEILRMNDGEGGPQ